jgi:hypothetical protein
MEHHDPWVGRRVLVFCHSSDFDGMRQADFAKELRATRRGGSQDEAERCGHAEFMKVGAAFDKPRPNRAFVFPLQETSTESPQTHAPRPAALSCLRHLGVGR